MVQLVLGMECTKACIGLNWIALSYMHCNLIDVLR